MNIDELARAASVQVRNTDSHHPIADAIRDAIKRYADELLGQIDDKAAARVIRKSLADIEG